MCFLGLGRPAGVLSGSGLSAVALVKYVISCKHLEMVEKQSAHTTYNGYKRVGSLLLEIFATLCSTTRISTERWIPRQRAEVHRAARTEANTAALAVG
jgi:hypothetical protein